MAFPQMAFGGIRSRKLAIASSDLTVPAIRLTALIVEAKTASSDLIIPAIALTGLVGDIKYADSDLVVNPVEINANISDIKSATSDLEVSPVAIAAQAFPVSFVASDLVIPSVSLETLQPQATLWTPSAITTRLWLDAADSSTITVATGVSQWNDKSGNNRNATASGSSQPLLVIGGQNGKNYIAFNGTSHRMLLASTNIFSSGNANLTIIAAYKPKMTSSTYGCLFGNYSDGNFQLLIGSQDVAFISPWGIYNDAALDIDNDAYIQNKNYISIAVRNSGNWIGYTDGIQKNTVANTASVYLGASTVSTWVIGSNTILSEFVNMDLYELIAINSAATVDTIDRLNGYIAHKWGLTANLASNHPYKTTPPYI